MRTVASADALANIATVSRDGRVKGCSSKNRYRSVRAIEHAAYYTVLNSALLSQCITVSNSRPHSTLCGVGCSSRGRGLLACSRLTLELV